MNHSQSGTEVVNLSPNRAVVRVQEDLAQLRQKVTSYATENTAAGNPRFKALVDRLEIIEAATLEDLSLGRLDNSLPDSETLWVELWTTTGDADEQEGRDAAIKAFASLTSGSERAVPVYRGRERDIYLVKATGETLKALPALVPDVVEVNRAAFVRDIELAEAADGDDPLAAVNPPDHEAAAVVAIHDTGVDTDHPYIKPVLLGADSVVPAIADGLDRHGHGTEMAGVAAFSALATGVAAGSIVADCWLVSIRLKESEADAGGDPDRGPMWAERTKESVELAEQLAEGRPTVHNLSLGADNDNEGLRVDRTAWSVAVDTLAWNYGHGRLLVVAAGNAEALVHRDDYPYVNLGPPHHHQPAQAWNAITVGGYTDLAELTRRDKLEGYPSPLAPAGGLSPFSRTRQGGNFPIKPDIVMEAGNTAPDGSGLDLPGAQGLSILTTAKSRPGGLALKRTWATSPAAAAASNALARIARAQPALAPATWRALLAHHTVWPEAARQQFQTRDLLRAFGYGVPDMTRSTHSASNRPVMVYEGSLVPSPARVRGERVRKADFIEVPLPFDVLDALGGADVILRITLSYFIEPTETLTRRAYAGGRLRWDFQGPAESDMGFRSRINRLVRNEGVAPGEGTYSWDVGTDARSRGTLQHDRATVSATSLAGSRLLAVYPVSGWWEDATTNHGRELPYSAVVSIDLGDIDLDVHSLVTQSLVSVRQEVTVDV
ncbi:S8 family peptidase [Catellatospora sp. NPDC049111]|uniref:S8 family peptidase n=1 Tax=Catellatospora sp. NPDC049111 TaxID=3155271 RepID=UPI0033CB00ED